jgi:hypothetical protein
MGVGGERRPLFSLQFAVFSFQFAVFSLQFAVCVCLNRVDRFLIQFSLLF